MECSGDEKKITENLKKEVKNRKKTTKNTGKKMKNYTSTAIKRNKSEYSLWSKDSNNQYKKIKNNQYKSYQPVVLTVSFFQYSMYTLGEIYELELRLLPSKILKSLQ